MDEKTTGLKDFLESRMPRYMEILEEMVGINSCTANPEGVDALGMFTAGVFGELGFEVEFVPSENRGCGRHLVLTRKGGGGKKIGLVSHLDTVFPGEEEKRNGFAWRVEGDRAYGPGTNDIKGGTVMMLALLEAVRRVDEDLYLDTTWVLLLDASEETESADFGRLCVGRLGGAAACLVFEGGEMIDGAWALVTARKGRAEFKMTAEGRGAHSGVSLGDGANAILQLSDAVRTVSGFTDFDRGLTFNIGTVSGGTVTNRVPHRAEARGEMRAFDPDVFEEGLSMLRSMDGYSSVKSRDGGYACRVRMEITRTSGSWPRNSLTDGLFEAWERASALLGMSAVAVERGGLSDGNHTWNSVPTIDGLGPLGDNCHCSEREPDGSKDQEYSVISSFVPKTVLNAFAVMDILGRG
ncbi:MAG: M20/M25/M40 family metallo-hydrolase [Spirochaetes bacterium]|jgi:glutamate carboxypeptidase|nr:M20/M25/M40 family metallo-hydrolase [Spirochaetota bacterium]